MKCPRVGVLIGQQIVDDKAQSDRRLGHFDERRFADEDGRWRRMAPENVRFVGQAVAVVIAETKNQAKDAGRAVVVIRRA